MPVVGKKAHRAGSGVDGVNPVSRPGERWDHAEFEAVELSDADSERLSPRGRK